ncbi:two-component system response regulator [Alkalilimnicola ehrlichii]|uniref:Two-component system response regulator n=1 Tax=Alkalilimnicola ehrlichii TaxID=351052 RepID=A0A3E0WN29_9GAMM|nr:response regulator [Alkalilimnicola ehrlichii]RFA26394.1 two-component system response regulator [Alkalilimnicola ehrlichii]RFA33457.1 two-component system response regulator [Alkalilimnicola ehrlichii]
MKRSDCPILLVEDDQVDAMTVRRALKEVGVKNPLVHFDNGEEALGFLSDSANDRPCIILLDLNMPVMNGIEFLQRIKEQPLLKRIPVVVLTTSREEQDKCRSFDFSIAGYMVKPVDYRQFVEIMRVIDAYWSLSASPPV